MSPRRTSLRQLFYQHQDKLSDTWSLYLSEYDRILGPLREKPVRLFEIGVQNGGSLEIWSKYFRSGQLFLGCDIDPKCADLRFTDPRIKVVVGDVTADATRKSILDQAAQFDIILDDGSHRSGDIIKAFVSYFSLLSSDGIYVVEDLHASYWQEYEGGLFYPWSAISFFKRLVDIANVEHWGVRRGFSEIILGFQRIYGVKLDEDVFLQVHSVEFLNSLCVIRKAPLSENRLGLRQVAGSEATVEPAVMGEHNHPSTPRFQEQNPWSTRETPPGDDALERDQDVRNLTAELAQRADQISSLASSLEERNRRISSLESLVAARDQKILALQDHVSELGRQLDSASGRLGTLASQVSQQGDRLQALAQQLSDRDQLVAGLQLQVRQITSGRAWAVASFLGKVRGILLPPGRWWTRAAGLIASILAAPFAPRRYLRDRRNLSLVRNSPWFDRDWYLARNPDVAQVRADPAYHYLHFGGFEGRDPGPAFSSQWYLDAYPDVRLASINPLVHYLRFGEKEGRARGVVSPGPAAPDRQAALLFISGCPGDAQRYRCVHQAELLARAGYTSDLAIYGQVDLWSGLNRYRGFVLHRVPYGPDVEAFVRDARSLGKPVLFDTDDLVFDPEAAEHIAALKIMDDAERELYFDGLRRYRATLLECDGVTVTTRPLADEVARLGKPVCVLPNVVSAEMVRLSQEALDSAIGAARSGICIAYLSGTHTHNDDFLEAADAVLWALERYPDVRFRLVGYLELDSRFDRFARRIEHLPLQPWQRLPGILRDVDINLAPLQKDNRFTEAKSCIKYLEAGLLSVPTIASKRTDFVRAIQDGVNGCLADSAEEWRSSLQMLIESRPLREQMGERARADVLQNHTTHSRAVRSEQDLRQFVQSIQAKGDRKLTVNWVLRAPIVGRGGGYRTIFRLANHLGTQGHRVRIYVEPVAHLVGMTNAEILDFTAKHFGPLNADVEVGHDHILPADATIATNWPTAFAVARHESSSYKFYFVQDYEPEFYDPEDPLYAAAETTYDLPLQPITIGRYLADRLRVRDDRAAEVIPFGIDSDTFAVTRPPADRPGRTRVLFFARPGLKRRGYGLGLKALDIAKRADPNLEIAFFGAETSELGDVPFEYEQLGILSPAQLASEMNRSHILLSLSLSNISWVPFEGMACGLAVVEADVPSVRGMVEADAICLAPPEPDAIASAVLDLAKHSDRRVGMATAAAAYMKSHTWAATCDEFERILVERCVL